MIPGIEVIDHDEHLWVLHKPAGLLSAPGRGPDKQDCLSVRVQAVDAQARLVHRLDQPTSGVLLMARNLAVQRLLNDAFASRQVSKIYLAVVAGVVSPHAQWQCIDAPIGLHWPDRPRHHVGPDGKPSLTWWRALAVHESDRHTLVALRPVTGRSHQLRLHMQHIGLPMLGDALYAPTAVAQSSSRLLLHAWQLGLKHPVSGDNRSWQAPCPVDWLGGFCQQAVALGLQNALINPPTGDVHA
jgi:tRNA pseudouridine32 synthase/23S rRNA pseudouridine746 synthase